MKKVTLPVAEVVIGGTCKKDCTDSYEWIGTRPNRVCNLVRTCTDKYGKVHQTSLPVADGECRPGG
ncbi:hypothetical protein D781_3616 [Serratia sp. FGI94]|uniref:DUF4762 family protein n=1 Tax=Serratia sp. FGI94 TaxID=671990 RepID=UPI0002A7128C|nr:DUF4762 family protein [Serratia sp. FGI94]AGB83820.1 hypothetical protein D781_3616 [Serratia sp. FGI94]